MHHVVLSTTFVAMFLASTLATLPSSAAVKETVVHDESKQGDLGPAKPDAKVAVRVSTPGVYVIRGTGIDAVDDVDAFVFQVEGDKPFDFCLVADAAEFKKLRAVDADGTVRDIAFGSTNPAFHAPRDITKNGLPPGKYHVEMFFGPQGAVGEWVVKIAPRDGKAPTEPLCKKEAEPATAEKMKKVDWPGTISIFHGHNWGDDEKYVVAIKEAGFGGVGSTEQQIEQCAKNGLRAFVFIWPHESAIIPAKHKNDKTVLCYYLSDRIQPHKWESWASLEKMACKGDPYHPAIFTMRGLWGAIDRFCPTVRGRAMEYYHYHWDGNRGPHMHFALLEQYRRASAVNGNVPICRIVETRPEDMRKTRQTIYTSLAYGVRGFRTGGRGIFDTNKRDQRGVPSRNAFGEEFKRINAAINAYSPIYKQTRCQAVYHTAPLPAGCVAAPDNAWVKPEGQEVLVGVFREHDAASEEKPAYLLVANRDAFHPRTATLKVAGKDALVERMDKRSAKWVEHASETKGDATHVQVALEDGGGELLKIVQRKPR